LGLALLQGEPSVMPRGAMAGMRRSRELCQRAIRAHQRPQARFDAVRALRQSRPAGQEWRVAGCDSSDGLLASLQAITATSGCGAVLDRHRLPVDPEMAGSAMGETWCLAGGEDYELVLALDPAWAMELLSRLPGGCCIGELVEASAGATLRWRNSDAPVVAGGGGYEHFRPA
jgi:thiamine-monophosphate kinase